MQKEAKSKEEENGFKISCVFKDSIDVIDLNKIIEETKDENELKFINLDEVELVS